MSVSVIHKLRTSYISDLIDSQTTEQKMCDCAAVSEYVGRNFIVYYCTNWINCIYCELLSGEYYAVNCKAQ